MKFPLLTSWKGENENKLLCFKSTRWYFLVVLEAWWFGRIDCLLDGVKLAWLPGFNTWCLDSEWRWQKWPCLWAEGRAVKCVTCCGVSRNYDPTKSLDCRFHRAAFVRFWMFLRQYPLYMWTVSSWAACLLFSASNRPFSSFSFVPGKRVKFCCYIQIIAMKCLKASEPETQDRKRYSHIPLVITSESRLAAFRKFGKNTILCYISKGFFYKACFCT